MDRCSYGDHEQEDLNTVFEVTFPFLLEMIGWGARAIRNLLIRQKKSSVNKLTVNNSEQFASTIKSVMDVMHNKINIEKCYKSEIIIEERHGLSL